jgi:hypothetical protein
MVATMFVSTVAVRCPRVAAHGLQVHLLVYEAHEWS